MKKFTFNVGIKYNFGDEVYVTTSGKKTWMKGKIIGWALGHPGFPVECTNENDEIRYQSLTSLPITYMVEVKDKDGECHNYRRAASSVFDRPAEEDIARLKKLKEQRQKLDDEISRIEQYL